MRILDREKLASVIEQHAQADLAEARIGGATVIVSQDGEVVYKNHFCNEEGYWQGLSNGTLFRLASMTKPLTAAAAMILVERGLLSPEDTVERFYPAFAEMQVENAEGPLTVTDQKVTVKHILTHTSGIASGTAWAKIYAGKMTPADKESVEGYISYLSRLPLSFVPGTKQEYSGTGAFNVLTGIIQKITGTSMEAFLKKEIFTPCRMNDTTFLPTEAHWARLIPMHDRVDGQSVIGKTRPGCVFESIPMENQLGGAGLVSSAADYLNFAQMLLNGGVFEGHRVLSQDSVVALTTPCVVKSKSESWGLGVRVITAQDALPVGAYGWSGAYGTHFWIDPTDRIIGIYMKNSRYDGGSGAVTSKVFEKDVYSALQE